ncbi:MAG: hypothetical protein WAO74_03235 [Polaribacter sp.]|uniref:hypothetical protein n=1 Tax=Polaribacter sp. TaxID=1920175 RepID=UPI003BAFD08E
MKKIAFILFSVFILSCVKDEKVAEQKQDSKLLLSVVNENSSVEIIDNIFRIEVENWEELNTLEVFLKRFKKASSNEILSNALELETLAKSLIDSIKPELFNIPSLNARINIFYNETLRLSDMSAIPAIKAEEVFEETEKIIKSFSAINAKINTILIKKRFEEEITVDVKYIGLDSTRIDSVSKRTINERMQQKLDEKNQKQNE